MTKKQARKLDLMTAKAASKLGHHEEARELFAKHGISYHVAPEVN